MTLYAEGATGEKRLILSVKSDTVISSADGTHFVRSVGGNNFRFGLTSKTMKRNGQTAPLRATGFYAKALVGTRPWRVFGMSLLRALGRALFMDIRRRAFFVPAPCRLTIRDRRE